MRLETQTREREREVGVGWGEGFRKIFTEKESFEVKIHIG